MDRYLTVTKRFDAGVIAVLPLLAIYELGLGQGMLGQNLNGADALLRIAVQWISAWLGLPMSRWVIVGIGGVAIAVFLGYLYRNRPNLRLRHLGGMYLEGAVLGLAIAVLVYLILGHQLPRFFTFAPNSGVVGQLARQGIASPWAMVVIASGAGVFEELVFRVLLLGGLTSRRINGSNRGGNNGGTAGAVVVTSAIFTVLHLGSVPLAGLVSVFTASVLLSEIYLHRGFGIAAITHTAFDLALMFGVVA